MPIQGYIYRLRKVGGLWFLRIGVYQFSFCVVRDRRLLWSTPIMIEHRTLRIANDPGNGLGM